MERVVFVVSTAALAFLAGFFSLYLNWIPRSAVAFLESGANELASKVDSDRSWYTVKQNRSQLDFQSNTDGSRDIGYTLVTQADGRSKISAQVVSPDRKSVHTWNTDWFDIFPNPEHVPEQFRPQSSPGTHIHGAYVAEDGDLIFNFEYLGMARINACSQVIWTLPYRTHHSIYVDEFETIWVPALTGEGGQYTENYDLETILRVSMDGEVLEQKRLSDLMRQNNIEGMAYLTRKKKPGAHRLKSLHLNDIEIFPSNMKEGFFSAGDIMLSLRDINTVLVFSRPDYKLKTSIFGHFVRQHDPDFVDGNRILIYDNDYKGLGSSPNHSRIIMFDARTNESSIVYSGTNSEPFFSAIMGKAQLLKNGDVLITESMEGRAFQVDSEGQIRWDYVNALGDGYAGIVDEATRLPEKFDAEFFRERRVACGLPK